MTHTDASDPPSPRPAFHLTAPAGHVNDPYGVIWTAGRYHLFHQLNPLGPHWSAQCHWGHVDGPDLVRWEHAQVALAPGGADHGCWSGTVVVADDVATMVYTSVAEQSWDIGRIAVAHGDPTLRQWTKDPAGPVLDGPPAGLGVEHFRDPFLWQDGDGWRMLVGAGLAGGVAAALRYSSPDLRSWTYDGVVCRRKSGAHDPLWTGTVWECPQLFELDGSWLLVVSVWSDGVGEYVACAVGDHDGSTFIPRTWHRYAYGDAPYATSCFIDAAGRRCAISWCRELEPSEPERVWAGVLSVPHLLALDAAGRPIITPHPDVDTLRTAEIARVTSSLGGPTLVPEQADVVLVVRLPGEDDHLEIELGGRAPWSIVLDRRAGLLRLLRPGRADQSMPLGATTGGQVDVRVLLDADVVEVFTAATAAAVRVPGRAGECPLTISGSTAAAVESLTIYAMERWFEE